MWVDGWLAHPGGVCSLSFFASVLVCSYDLIHYGHANNMRQSKAFGTVLVVGVHGDGSTFSLDLKLVIQFRRHCFLVLEEITRNKGPPVMNERERYAIV